MFRSSLTTGVLPTAIAPIVLALSLAWMPPASAQEDPEAPQPEQAVPPVPAGAPSVPGAQNTDPRADDDNNFLLLREAARQNDSAKVNALASRLQHYQLASYVDYYRLKPRLREAARCERLRAARLRSGRAQIRSSIPTTPEALAQCAQQYMVPSCSAPWPMIMQPQCAHFGASLWMAHSNESKVPLPIGPLIEKPLS